MSDKLKECPIILITSRGDEKFLRSKQPDKARRPYLLHIGNHDGDPQEFVVFLTLKERDEVNDLIIELTTNGNLDACETSLYPWNNRCGYQFSTAVELLKAIDKNANYMHKA